MICTVFILGKKCKNAKRKHKDSPLSLTPLSLLAPIPPYTPKRAKLSLVFFLIFLLIKHEQMFDF